MNISDIKVYQTVSKDEEVWNTVVLRMALHPMDVAPISSGYCKEGSVRFPFRVVFTYVHVSYFSKFVEPWCYSCRGIDVSIKRAGVTIKKKGLTNDQAAVQWLLEGEDWYRKKKELRYEEN